MANFTFNTTTNNQVLERSNIVPTSILSQDLMSPTSEAYECFVDQVFCGNLQTYLINYVLSVSSYYSVKM